MKARLLVGVTLACAMLSAFVGCAPHPSPPTVVGENFPGTCLPGELRWPTDFIESLPGASSAVGGRIVGLRLEYVDSEWVWRLRSAAQKTNLLGQRENDPSFGRDSIVDARTLAVVSSYDAELSTAEQEEGTSAYEVAQRAGEEWPSTLIIEMARVRENDESMWQITTCDTETSEHHVETLR
ncbi:hypothetical protein [Microbacterium imperiale]|uniref:Uncharacterized protein n=1 Tax=Microbacterium imperiale TaxID=33884 RepID=A0A9W6HEU2_9MICO|nr:hypothetical protein [Microbacterium imperiale]MBP2419464.1 hypothetical protein [Microbacterium imperiale]MDS0198666.1 hypothetical protein [Microbacterium imperiale]BFE39806.1 hypothetical protein GCM10017544_07620 [Microbacterium imperiale]GLJ79219.1 hypothetical protein GCM10017586_09010 [Microbacterium imperiale]